MELRTVRISSKRQITLPKSFIDFKEGDKALLINKKDEIVLRPIRNVNDATLLAEKSLSDCWNSKEDDKAFAYLQK